MTGKKPDPLALDDMMAVLANIALGQPPEDASMESTMPLNPQSLLEDLQNFKKERDMAQKASFKKKKKKVEKSMGYFDKLAARDKQRKRAAQPPPLSKPKKK
jgi:hypothetical protein